MTMPQLFAARNQEGGPSKFQIVTQIVLPSLALLASIAVGLWPFVTQPQKGLRYEVVAVTPLGPAQARGFGDLKLLKGDRLISEPYLASVRFTNGDVEIQQSHFAVPITIRAEPTPGSTFFLNFGFWATPDKTAKIVGEGRIPKPVEFIDARVAGKKPENLPVTLTYSPRDVAIAPLLLNPLDEFLVEILVDGGPPSLKAEARIAGIRELEETVPTVDKKARAQGILLVVLTSFLTFIALLMWVSMMMPLRKPLLMQKKWILGIFFVMVVVAAVLVRLGSEMLRIEQFGASYWRMLAWVYGIPVLLTFWIAWVNRPLRSTASLAQQDAKLR